MTSFTSLTDFNFIRHSPRHPVPAALSRDEGTGRVPGHNGGVWEFVRQPSGLNYQNRIPI